MKTIYPMVAKFFARTPAAKPAVLLFATAFLFLAPLFVNAQAVNKQDSLALVTLYDSTGGALWSKAWNLHTPVIKWTGISLANGRVVNLNLYGNKLNGKIPSALGNLSALTSLNLGKNNLTGPIPSALGSLTSLTVLSLAYDNLTGTIPSSASNLVKLTSLVLSNNALSGRIPAVVWSLKGLTDLELNGNSLSDTISASISNLVNLTQLDLSANQLSGQIPQALLKLSSLYFINLNNNKLKGNIPSSIGNLSGLTYLDLSGNSLTGPIPASIWKLANLQFLYIGGNQLTGTLSSSVSNLKKIQGFSVSGNYLTDTVPVKSFLQLSKLVSLDLTWNNFTFTSFESAQALTKLLGSGYYSQQQNIPVYYTAGKLSAGGGGTLTKKAYKWFATAAQGNTTTNTTIYKDSNYVPQLTGTYNVDVTDSLVPGLTLHSNSIFVKLPQQITITAGPGMVICANTLVTVKAAVINQYGKVTYQWKKDGKAVGANAATYADSTLKNGDSLECILTDSGKTATSNVLKFTVNADVKPAVTVNYTPTAAVGTGICPGTKVEFTAEVENGGTAPVYKWYKNGVATGTNSDVYTDTLLKNADSVAVVLTSNAACVINKEAVSKYVKITVLHGKPVAPVITGSSSVKAGEKGIGFKVPNVAGITYLWAVSSGDSIKAGQGTDSITVKWGSAAGQVSVKESDACGSITVAKSISVATGGADPKYLPGGNTDAKVLLYPNPATDAANLQISGFSGKVVITVTDMTGKIMLQQERLAGGTFALPLDKLAQGLYIVTVRDANNLRSLKLVKSK